MQMRIGGAEETSHREAWIPVINPATGEEIDQVPSGDAEDVARAVEAAGRAQEVWAARSMRDRGKILFLTAERIREMHPALAMLLTREQGKPIKEAIDEIRGFANILEFYAGISAHPTEEFLSLGRFGDCIVTREPLGVCGAIIPWNMPAIILGWKVAPALLTGNTVVVKPSSTAPLTSLSLCGILEQAGLPPGVLNMVTGTGESAGMPLVRHPGIRKISFTGSTETGYMVLHAAREHLKEVTLELGGSDPMIVWEDAPLEQALDGVMKGRFYNAGQTCTSVKRLLLHQSIADRFIADLVARSKTLRVGNGLDPQTEMGPLHTAALRDHLARLTDQSGGEILLGGVPLDIPPYDRGHFYPPTLVTDLPSDSALLTQEVFGPVLPIVVFSDLEEAIQRANASQYGLGASIWTRDREIADTVFRKVHAGLVWVNRHLTVPPEVPFGGMKESGMGKENGYQALSQYTQIRSLIIGR